MCLCLTVQNKSFNIQASADVMNQKARVSCRSKHAAVDHFKKTFTHVYIIVVQQYLLMHCMVVVSNSRNQ